MQETIEILLSNKFHTLITNHHLKYKTEFEYTDKSGIALTKFLDQIIEILLVHYGLNNDVKSINYVYKTKVIDSSYLKK